MRKELSVQFARKCLEKSGITTEQEGNNLFADLAQDRDLVINISNGTLSVAVVMAEGEESDICFRTQTKCESREKFMYIFDSLFKELLCAVRNYIEMRDKCIGETFGTLTCGTENASII